MQLARAETELGAGSLVPHETLTSVDVEPNIPESQSDSEDPDDKEVNENSIQTDRSKSIDNDDIYTLICVFSLKNYIYHKNLK